jgi:hypothetical protein
MDESQNLITQAEEAPGTALFLQNYEQDPSGGYQTILGYSKFDPNTVPGSGPVLGVKVALGGVFAARGDNVYFSTGSGWGSPVNTAPRTGVTGKYRFIDYIYSVPVIVMCDGVNRAAKYDGSTYTLINGTGAPTNPSFATYHLSRLVLSGYSANRAAISVSAPNDDEDFAGASGAIELSVGDEVTGLRAFRGTLYIFCKSSIKKLVGSSASDFTVQDVTMNIGCLATDSIQEVGGDIVFLAPDGIRSLAATDRNDDVELASLSRPIKRILSENIAGKSSAQFSATTVREKSQYRLFVYEPSYADPVSFGVIGKLNLSERLQFAWSILRGFNAYCCDSNYLGSAEFIVFGHPSNGYVYRQESGNTFDGATIPYVYQTPFYTFGDENIRKVIQKFHLYVRQTGDLDINVSLSYNYGDSNYPRPPSVRVRAASGAAMYGSAIYGLSRYTARLERKYSRNAIGSCNNVSFLISGQVPAPAHRIDSIHVEFAPKGRR